MSEIRTKITVDSSKVKSGLDSAKNSVSSWAKDVRSQVVGAFAAGAIINSAKETADRLSQIGDAANRSDWGVESMQALVLMAKQANIELTQIEKLLNSFSDAQISIASGQNQKNIDAVNNLGITREQVNKMTPEEFVKSLVAGLNTKGITGRAGIQDALPFLNSKMAGVVNSLIGDLSNLDENIKAYIENRSIVTKGEVAKIKSASDSLETSWTSLKNSLVPLTTILIKSLDTIVTIFNDFIGAFTGRKGQMGNIKKIWFGAVQPLQAPLPIDLPRNEMPTPDGSHKNSTMAVKTPLSVYTDSLLGKGNMLGQSSLSGNIPFTAKLLTVSKQQLKVAEDSKKEQEKINHNINRVLDRLGFDVIP